MSPLVRAAAPLAVLAALVVCACTKPAPSESGPTGPSAPAPAPSVTSEAKAKMLQKVLDLDALAPFWHRELPGRVPLKMIANDAVADAPPLVLFGAKVVYVDKVEAERAKLPFFEVTKLTSSGGKTRIEFRYPAEGVVGHVELTRRGDDWQITEKHVAER